MISAVDGVIEVKQSVPCFVSSGQVGRAAPATVSNGIGYLLSGSCCIGTCLTCEALSDDVNVEVGLLLALTERTGSAQCGQFVDSVRLSNFLRKNGRNRGVP